MKTTPLPEILKQITPLPYKTATGEDWDGATIFHGEAYPVGARVVATCEGCDIPGMSGEQGADQAKASAAYLAHAANVLPGLVEALREAIVALDMDDNFGDDIDARHAAEEKAFLVCSSALALAANVPVNS